MQSVEKIILAHEGMEALKLCESIRVEHEEDPLLVIEYLGKGPTEREALGVGQFVKQDNGRWLCCREMQFELTVDREWFPFLLSSETTGELKHVYESAAVPRSSRLRSLLRVNRKVFLELQQLACEWDAELESACYRGAPKSTRYYPLFDDLDQPEDEE